MSDQSVSTAKAVCEIRMPAEARSEAAIKAFTEVCHKFNLEAKIRGASTRGAPRTNPEGEIKVVFADTNFFIILKDARKARKWLRKHSLTVVNAKKEGSVWTFPKTTKSIEVALKGVKAKAAEVAKPSAAPAILLPEKK